MSVTGEFRQGDIRHNYADLTKIQEAVGFSPQFTFREGLKKFLTSAEDQDATLVGYESSLEGSCEGVGSFMDRRKSVGVVTVTYNSGAVIDDFMRSILSQTYLDFTLFVVDNASSDDTLERLASYNDARIAVIPSQVNAGVAEGNNVGIRASLENECGLVLLINNDTVFDPTLITKLTEGLLEYECDMVVPKILYFDDPNKIWSAGGYFSVWRGSTRHIGCGQKDDGRFDQPRAISYNPTCCMLLKHEVFDRIGLMDSNYFVYFDDTDFCLRALRAGLKLFYLPDARLEHKVSSLTGDNSSFTVRYRTRNHIYYLLKNFPRWRILYYAPAFYIHIIGKYLFLWRRPRTYWVAHKAFWEGISLFISKMSPLGRKLKQTGLH